MLLDDEQRKEVHRIWHEQVRENFEVQELVDMAVPSMNALAALSDKLSPSIIHELAILLALGRHYADSVCPECMELAKEISEGLISYIKKGLGEPDNPKPS